MQACRGTVASVFAREKYAVAYPLKGGDVPPELTDKSITFNLEDWRGEVEPQKGQVIDLDGLWRHARGWRARSATPAAS